MLKESHLSAALETAPLFIFERHVYRNSDASYSSSILSGEGALDAPARYHVPGVCATLYLAQDVDLSLLETNAILRSPDKSGLFTSAPFAPRTLVTVNARIEAVLDLCAPEIRRLLHTSVDELIAPWTPYYADETTAPTQELGIAAFRTGRVTALRAPSFKDPSRWNLIVFPERLGDKDTLRIVTD